MKPLNTKSTEQYRLDALDIRILETLVAAARTSMTDLARMVGISSPSVTERVRNLESAGLIRAYTLDLDPVKLGYTPFSCQQGILISLARVLMCHFQKTNALDNAV